MIEDKIRLTQELEEKLFNFNKEVRRLPGIRSKQARITFIKQLVDSIRRIQYVKVIDSSEVKESRTNPALDIFDPLKASIWHKRQGNIDESFWLIFIAIHFGKNKRSGWHLSRNVYGGLGEKVWNWKNVSDDPGKFRQWLSRKEDILKKTGSFGNHRKYESLNAYKSTGTGEAFESYVHWVGPSKNHLTKIQKLKTEKGESPRVLFHSLYQSMNAVQRFGRTAKFDYLTMIGKLQLCSIEPGSAYMTGATGPLTGARLIFGGKKDANLDKDTLDNWLVELDSAFGLYFGMQVLEDALCNWQKSPTEYIFFRG